MPAAPSPAQAAGNANDAAGKATWAEPLETFRRSARAATESEGEDDVALSGLLASIAEDVQREAGMERAGIIADFGARMRYARRHIPRNVLAGILRELKAQKAAALAARKTSARMKSRLTAARRSYRCGHLRPDGPGMH